MNEPTPGKWHYNDDFAEIQSDQNIPLAKVLNDSDVDDLPTVWANAQLMAAAPELYAALRRFIQYVDDFSLPGFDCPDAVEYVIYKQAERAIESADKEVHAD